MENDDWLEGYIKEHGVPHDFDSIADMLHEYEAYLETTPKRESRNLSNVRSALHDAIKNTEVRLQDSFVDERLRKYLVGLCEEVGYGNVMASVGRLWRDKDPIGAFALGMCIGTERTSLKLLKEALSEIEDRGSDV